MKFSPATHWLRTEHVNSNVSAMKNKSELLLEGYLRNNGESDFDFEPEIRGCAFYLFIRQPMGRKSALRRERPWILRGFQGRLSC